MFPCLSNCFSFSPRPHQIPEDVNEDDVIIPTTPTSPTPPSPGPILSWLIEKDGRIGLLCSPFDARDNCCSRSPVEFFLNRLFGFSQPIVLIPPGATAVSISAENFRVGNCPNDFRGFSNLPEGSLTFQKVSRHVTATFYTSGGKDYLAGLTFAFDTPSDPSDVISLELAWLIRRRFPDEHVVHNEPRYGRDCQRAGGRVLVGCNGVNRILLHYRWHWQTGEFRTDYCVECEAHQAETTSTVVAAHLGITIRQLSLPLPPTNSPQISLAETLESTSDLSDVTDDFSSSFSQMDTDEAEE